MPPQLLGAVVTGHDAPLDVEIDSAGGVPTQVVLRTTLTLSGGSAPGVHTETVVLPVHGTVVHDRELAVRMTASLQNAPRATARESLPGPFT